MASWAKWAHINHKEILGYHFADPIHSANYIDQVRELKKVKTTFYDILDDLPHL